MRGGRNQSWTDSDIGIASEDRSRVLGALRQISESQNLSTTREGFLREISPSRLVLEGGTHASMAPPFEFIVRTFLPILERMGPQVSARLVRHGFFPRGGGRIEVDIEPAPLRRIDCLDRGKPLGHGAMALFASLPGEIAVRMVKAAHKELPAWSDADFALCELPADQGPGIALLLEAAFEHVTEVVSGFGKLGVPAERLGRTAGKRMAGYVASKSVRRAVPTGPAVTALCLGWRGDFHEREA